MPQSNRNCIWSKAQRATLSNWATNSCRFNEFNLSHVFVNACARAQNIWKQIIIQSLLHGTLNIFGTLFDTISIFETTNFWSYASNILQWEATRFIFPCQRNFLFTLRKFCDTLVIQTSQVGGRNFPCLDTYHRFLYDTEVSVFIDSSQSTVESGFDSTIVKVILNKLW